MEESNFEEYKKIKNFKTNHIYITSWGIKFLLYTSNDNIIKALCLNGNRAGKSEIFELDWAMGYLNDYRIIK